MYNTSSPYRTVHRTRLPIFRRRSSAQCWAGEAQEAGQEAWETGQQLPANQDGTLYCLESRGVDFISFELCLLCRHRSAGGALAGQL